jgi:hypothetical protein
MDGTEDRVAFFEQYESQSQLSAIELMVAETAMLEKPYFIGVEPDPMPYDGDAHYDGPVWTVTLYTVVDRMEPAIAASMGGVAGERDDPYIRITAAELAYDEIVAPWLKRKGE